MTSATQKSHRSEPTTVRKRTEPEVHQAPKAETNRPIKICVAAWLIPGLGHYVLGKRVRAVVLFLAIVSMVVLGLLMHGTVFQLGSASILERLGYLGELCSGLAVPLAKFFGYAGGKPFFVSADYGTAYLVSAGMCNLLAILDAYDITVGRKR